MRVLFVGMNPGNPNGGRPSGTIKRMNRWADELGVDFYSFVNCFHVPGDRGRVTWSFLQGCCKGYDKVVALGNFASDTLRRLDINHHKMPHPSGRNRLLNDPAFEREAISSCKSYLFDIEEHCGISNRDDEV